MAPDNIHHIEGVLLPSNDFRLYVYDEYTKPLSAEKVRKSKAYLTVEGSTTRFSFLFVPRLRSVQALLQALGVGDGLTA